MTITETKFARPDKVFRSVADGHGAFKVGEGNIEDQEYEAWMFPFHDNGWVLLAIRPDGLHIFGKFKGDI